MLKVEELQKMSNEELVLLIQKADENNCTDYQKNLYWDVLYEKTKKCIFNTFNKYVNAKYKNEEKDDIIMILKGGWVKAVFKYDITKDNTKTCFVPFAQHIMWQEYMNTFAKRMSSNRTGVSVNTMLLNSINTAKAQMDNKKINYNEIISDKRGEKEYELIELKDLLKKKLKILKHYYPKSYIMIVEHIYNEKTQNDIAIEYNINQASVARHIRKGKMFLKEIITPEEKELCLYNRKG